MPSIYITTNNINNKKYIGVDTKDKKSYLGSGIIIKESIKKYGKNNFTKEIIESNDDIQYLFEREKYWIQYYNAVDSSDFYNISEGGKGGNMLNNKESIKKWKVGSIKAIEMSNLKMKNKTYDEIYGDRANEEREKRRNGLIGKKHTEERNKNFSESNKGRTPWNKGLTKEDSRVRKNSENMIKNHRKTLKIYILTTLNNEKIQFQGKKELEDYFKTINTNKKFKDRITVDKLIQEKTLKGYQLEFFLSKIT